MMIFGEAPLGVRGGRPARRPQVWVVAAICSMAALHPLGSIAGETGERPKAEAAGVAAISAIDAAVSRALASGSPGMSVAVADASGTLFSRGYGLADLENRTSVTSETVFSIASVTKQFTAAAVLLMMEEGRLSIDDKLSKYVPELAGADGVTIRQLLVQTSGVADYAEDPAGDATKSVSRTPAEMVQWINRLNSPRTFPAGTSWAYSNSNYVLLGLVVERVSGKSLKSVFEDRLFKPAGMTATAFDDPAHVVPHRARGYRRSRSAPSGYLNAAWISPTIPGPAGGLRSTSGDLLAWNRALFGGRILRPESLKLMTTPGQLNDGRTTKQAMPVPMQQGWNSDYAMGLLIGSPSSQARVWHSGEMDGFSSWVAYYPEAGVTLVILQNSQSAERMEADLEAAALRLAASRRGAATGSPAAKAR